MSTLTSDVADLALAFLADDANERPLDAALDNAALEDAALDDAVLFSLFTSKNFLLPDEDELLVLF